MLPCSAVFGFSFSELVVVVIVALVVMGPKDLPKMLRRLGQWAGKIRRAAADLRAQSGIDDALRSEGLADDIAEIRKLARGELDAVQRVARIDDVVGAPRAALPSPASGADPYGHGADFYVVRDREYPREGPDTYNALPDNAIVYAGSLPKSALARDALYALGDADAVFPPEPNEPNETAAQDSSGFDVPAVPVPTETPLPIDTAAPAASDAAPASDIAKADAEPSHP